MTNRIILRKGTRQRLELRETDLQILVFLEQQRLLTLQQFYQASTRLFNIDMQEYSFKNRIRKFEEYRLLRSWQYSEGFKGERFKYIAIGSKGIDLLMEQKLLDSTYNKPGIYKFNQKKNLMHYLLTQQAAINILSSFNGKLAMDEQKKIEKYPLIYDKTLFSHPPAKFQYTEWIRKERNLHRQNSGAYHASIAKYMTSNHSADELRGSTMTIVKPDWVLEIKGKGDTKDAVINIELDMGTEPIETLAQKLFRYAIVAQNNPDVLHIMNIVVADNSFSKRSTLSDGLGRAQNINTRFQEDEAVLKRLEESGLKIIIYPLKYNPSAIAKALIRY